MPEWKYDQLREALRIFQVERKRYEEECEEFIRTFRQEVANYLNCAPEAVTFEMYNEEELNTQTVPLDQFVRFSFPPSMWLDNDAFWNFRLRISIDKGKEITIFFRVKKMADSFFVGFLEEEFEVQEGQLKEPIEHAFNVVVDWLKTDHENFMKGEKKKPPIGFKVPEA